MVYQVKSLSESEFLSALKIQKVSDCIKFSLLFIEVGFCLMVPDRLPLIQLEDLFTHYDPTSEDRFFLNILMQKTE